MENFLKGIGAKAKDLFTLTDKEKAAGKKANALESVTKTIGDFFAPKDAAVRTRDFLRELPGATADVAKEIAKGTTRFALSTGEAVARVPQELAALTNPGEARKEKIYEPEKIPGLGILGPIESYQNQAARERAAGGSATLGTLKQVGNIAMDEPVGVALKPLGLAFGAFVKGGGAKMVENAIEDLVKTVNPEEVKTLLKSIGIGEQAAKDLADPIAKATTIDEVKGILGYTDKGATKTGKEAVEGVTRETGQTYYHGTPAKYADDITKNGYNAEKAAELGSEKSKTMFLSTDKGYANGYSKTLADQGDEGAVLAFKIKPDAVVYDVANDTIKKESGEVIQKNVTEFVNGKKGAAHPEYKNTGDIAKQYGVDVIKTKDGLETEILNQKVIQPVTEAVKKTPKATFLIPEKPEEKKVFDEAAKWLTDWVAGKKPKMPSPEVEAYLSQFKSKKPLNLYRGTGSSKKSGLTSWTVNTRTAKEMGVESEKKGAQVLSEKIKPNDILVDLNMLDQEVKDLMLSKVKDKKLRNEIEMFMDTEGEVIVKPRNAVESIKEGMKPTKAPTGVEGAPSIGDIMKKGETGGGAIPPKEPATMADIVPGGKQPERKFITRVKADAPEMADLLQGKYTPKSNKELIANAEKIIAEDPIRADVLARTGTDDQSVAIATKMVEDQINLAKSSASELVKTEAYAKAAEIANEAAKNLTEAGRAVQAASLLGKMTPEGMARYAAREIQKYNEQAGAKTLKNFLGGTKKIPELTGEQLKDITDTMTSINAMEDGMDKARALKKLGDKIQSMIPSSLFDKITNVWKAGLLTGLKTTGVNVASNISHSISEIAKDVPAAFVDKIASLFTGERTLALTGKDTYKGAAEGMKKGWDFLKTGFDERNIADKLDYKKVNFGKGPVADALKKYTDTVFGLLGAEDQPFYYAAKARSLANQAAAMAKNAGLKGKQAIEFAEKLIENPTDEMMKYSTLDAETAVFQQDSWVAKKGKQAQKVFGQIILPFAKTPANVAEAMINYSPVGIVKGVIDQIVKGKFDQRLFSQAMGRGITGTGALAIGSALMANGLMNLTTPTTEKERKQWELEGRIPNSIKIGDKWRNIGVLGPLGMVLMIGGNLRQGIDKTGSFAGGLVQAGAGSAKALTEQTFLSGVNKVIDALTDPQRSFNGFASSLAGSIVPTLVGDVARLTDKFERRSQGPLERIVSRIPGARRTLEPQVDTFGKAKETPNFFEVMADPTRPGNATADKNDPVVLELRRLMDADHGITPTQVGPTNGYESITPEQNTFLWKLSGQMAKSEIEKEIKSKAYARYDDEQKAQAIDRAVQDAKIEARARIVVKALKGMSDAEQKAKLAEMKDDGLLTKQVFSKYLSLTRNQ